jgi:hypothetical protein
MNVLDTLTKALRYSARLVRAGAALQQAARTKLVTDLQGICSNVEDSYDAVLKRLLPIKSAARDPKALASEIHAFRADSATKQKFKPDHLCGRVDQILMDLESNLTPLKYSLDVSRLGEIKNELGAVGKFDGAFYISYDDFTSDLDRLALEIDKCLPTNPSAAQAIAAQILELILVFEDELKTGIADVRDIKDRILHGK